MPAVRGVRSCGALGCVRSGECAGMEMKVKDLTVAEFQSLISDTMRATLKDLIEDVSALSSPEYLKSIEEERNDYREGRVKHFEELFDV